MFLLAKGPLEQNYSTTSESPAINSELVSQTSIGRSGEFLYISKTIQIAA